MQNKNTFLEKALSQTRLRNFIIFPLPGNADEYHEYMARLYKRFPPGDLRLVARDGIEYAIGSLADLRLLFPARVVHNEGPQIVNSSLH
jgi:hypothetical protein